MSLDVLRSQIDAIDKQLVALYAQRMEVVRQVAEEKSKNGGAVLDPLREKALVNRAALSVAPALMPFVKQLYTVILDTSKAYQTHYISVPSPIKADIAAALAQKERFPAYGTVAVQGTLGAYSHLATERLFSLSDITFTKNFEGVFNAVQSGLCTYGVLPIENSTAGSVNAVYDLMRKYHFHIARSLKLPVRHSLLAKKGATLQGVREIVSHEQALSQCDNYLKNTFKNAKITVMENTAVAAKLVAESDRLDLAVLASPQCAELYGLASLAAGVQDNDNNFTRFICITKPLTFFAGADKMSVMMTLPHESGSLNRVLAQFAGIGLNLTKLESRPWLSTDFEFLFYFDFQGDIESPEALNLVAELDAKAGAFTFLGAYQEG
ncbi:MAG: chorismate mutase [Clostridiales bacterium]|jgi:chorismate mutase/prephenate dehydratase|nr:chorismate mutase [Clostridiales bacterium]